MREYSHIKIMSPELASRIAAGEVVGRPASVVKELIENSLDAGAKSIEVEVSLARRRIRVKDDGFGIAPGELELAVSRHGTSKIKSENDIFAIGTYGFRGEALPSIASISRFTLSSFRNGSPSGRSIIVEGGKTLGLYDAPPLKGTEILVENLFYNTPARRKFIRTNSTEMTHITTRVIHAALGAPETRFTFIKEKSRMLELPPTTEFAQRVRQLFGREYTDNLVPIDYSDFGISVTGLAGKPDFNRATAMDQYFFVNSRPVKDGVIRAATARAYMDLLPRGRKPVIFINVIIDPASVDVNVHPSKEEVRYSNPASISEAVGKAIRKALDKGAGVNRERARVFSQDTGRFNGEAGKTGMPVADRTAFTRTFEIWSRPEEEAEPAKPQLDLKPADGRLGSNVTVVGQLFKTFLVLEEGPRMIVMDQHTVHERILYERIMKRYLESKMEIQMLLTAVNLNTDPKTAEVVRSHLKTFSDLGWGVEEFGPSDFVIRNVPALMVGKDYTAIIIELAETISQNRDSEFKVMISGCVSRMACRAAVKSGDVLSRREIIALVEELSRTELPYTCPHGRPVAMEIDREMLFKKFGRT